MADVGSLNRMQLSNTSRTSSTNSSELQQINNIISPKATTSTSRIDNGNNFVVIDPVLRENTSPDSGILSQDDSPYALINSTNFS